MQAWHVLLVTLALFLLLALNLIGILVSPGTP